MQLRRPLVASRLPRPLSVALITLAAAPCFAEAGLSSSFCTELSCGCGAAWCTCGQVCNLPQQRCEPAQAGFCRQDSDCAGTGSCDRFVCEGNVCVRGSRDAGSADVDGGSGPSTPAGGCGCRSTVDPFVATALLLGLVVPRRRPRRG